MDDRGDAVEALVATEQQRSAVVTAVLATVSRGDLVRVADLADLSGMSRPTFYKYLPSLEGALLHTHQVELC